MNAPLPATLHKFKVLSLDPRGDQFMVRMDLSQEWGGQTDPLVDMEVLIAQNAKSRHNIRVTAVYWRMSEMVSVGRPRQGQGRGNRAAAATLPVRAVAKGVSTRSGPRSYTLLTGFEDTEVPDTPGVVPALSASQYGDLN